MTVQTLPDILVISEAAVVARVSERTLRRHIASGELRATYIGRCLRVQRKELDRWLDERTAS